MEYWLPQNLVGYLTSTRIFHEFDALICYALGGEAVLMLPQTRDNTANGRLGLTRRVKIFMLIRVLTKLIRYKMSTVKCNPNSF